MALLDKLNEAEFGVHKVKKIYTNIYIYIFIQYIYILYF